MQTRRNVARQIAEVSGKLHALDNIGRIWRFLPTVINRNGVTGEESVARVGHWEMLPPLPSEDGTE